MWMRTPNKRAQSSQIPPTPGGGGGPPHFLVLYASSWSTGQQGPGSFLLAASASAMLLLSAKPGLAFGPVSVKLSDIHVERVECQGRVGQGGVQ